MGPIRVRFGFEIHLFFIILLIYLGIKYLLLLTYSYIKTSLIANIYKSKKLFVLQFQ